MHKKLDSVEQSQNRLALKLVQLESKLTQGVEANSKAVDLLKSNINQKLADLRELLCSSLYDRGIDPNANKELMF